MEESNACRSIREVKISKAAGRQERRPCQSRLSYRDRLDMSGVNAVFHLDFNAATGRGNIAARGSRRALEITPLERRDEGHDAVDAANEY